MVCCVVVCRMAGPGNDSFCRGGADDSEIRAYTGEGAKELFEIVAERKDELESVFRSVSGIISYTAVHTEEGGFTVTVCKNPAGISESVRLAREWVAKRAGHLKLSDPQIIEGFSLIHFTEQ